MALRYKATTNILVGGNTLAHGLGGTPDEYFFSPTIAPGGSMPYFMGVSSTNITIATTAGGTTGVVFAAINSTLVK